MIGISHILQSDFHLIFTWRAKIKRVVNLDIHGCISISLHRESGIAHSYYSAFCSQGGRFFGRLFNGSRLIMKIYAIPNLLSRSLYFDIQPSDQANENSIQSSYAQKNEFPASRGLEPSDGLPSITNTRCHVHCRLFHKLPSFANNLFRAPMEVP